MACGMLRIARMKSALLVAAVLAGVSATASAGGFVGLGVGAEPAVNDGLMETGIFPAGRSLRVLGGYRFNNNLSVEGAINGFGVATGRGDQTVYQVAAGAKFNLPLGNDFEAFGRAGLEHTTLDLGDSRYNLGGNGFLVGAGFEYKLNAVIAGAGLFVDYTIHHATLEDARSNQVSETSRIWALGVTYGF